MERLKSILVVHCSLALVSLLGVICIDVRYLGLWLVQVIALGQLMALAVLLYLPEGRLRWKYLFTAGMILAQTFAHWAAGGHVVPRFKNVESSIVLNPWLMPGIWFGLLIGLHGILKLCSPFLGEVRRVRFPERKELRRRQKQFSILSIMAAVTGLAVVLGLALALDETDPDDLAAYTMLLVSMIGVICAAITLLGIWAALCSRDAEFRVAAVFVVSACAGSAIGEWFAFAFVFSTAILMGMLMHLRSLQYRLVPKDWSEEP